MARPHAGPRPGGGEPWMRPRRFPRWQGASHRCSRPQLVSEGEDGQGDFPRSDPGDERSSIVTQGQPALQLRRARTRKAQISKLTRRILIKPAIPLVRWLRLATGLEFSVVFGGTLEDRRRWGDLRLGGRKIASGCGAHQEGRVSPRPAQSRSSRGVIRSRLAGG